MLPVVCAAAVVSGCVGYGVRMAVEQHTVHADSAALVPSMVVQGTPSRPAADFYLTGAPTLPPQLPSAVAALQWAGWPGFDNIRFREGYVSSFNRMTKNPNWVCEHLCKETLSGDAKRSKGGEPFAEDTHDPPHMRSTLGDYKGSGFDRGHLVAAGDIKFSQKALEETFILSNISPQVGAGFNRGYWERLERWCRGLVHRNEFSDVFVITGPLFIPEKQPGGAWFMHHQVLGNPPALHVPTHFFKVVMALPTRSTQATLTLSAQSDRDAGGHALVPAGRAPERPIALGAFVLPNAVIADSEPLEKFAFPLELLERTSGLEFFQRLPRQNGRFVSPLCRSTKCQLPPPFDKGGKDAGKKLTGR